MNAKEALQKLIEGNERFYNSNHFFPNLVEERRLELVSGQNPFAIIISCSDSRVPAEIVFDRGLGDLFVIRNAGNIISSSVIGSVEYAISYLEVPLIVILGHDDCSAVKASINSASNSFFVRGIQEKIFPAVEKARKQEGDLIYNSIINNVQIQGSKLKTAGNIIPEYIADGRVEIKGGYYCLKTGRINFFDIE